MTYRSLRAAGVSAYSSISIGAASGTQRSAILDVCVDRGRNNRVTSVFLGFQRPLFLRAINLAEVVNAGVLLGGCASFHKVGDRDRSQQADDGHNDHDFHKRET